MRELRPKIVFIIDPRISSTAADIVCKSLGKKRWIISEVRGFSGGIWVLWDEREIGAKLEVAHKSFLEVRSSNGQKWVLIAMYASPQPSIR